MDRRHFLGSVAAVPALTVIARQDAVAHVTGSAAPLMPTPVPEPTPVASPTPDDEGWVDLAALAHRAAELLVAAYARPVQLWSIGAAGARASDDVLLKTGSCVRFVTSGPTAAADVQHDVYLRQEHQRLHVPQYDVTLDEAYDVMCDVCVPVMKGKPMPVPDHELAVVAQNLARLMAADQLDGPVPAMTATLDLPIPQGVECAQVRHGGLSLRVIRAFDAAGYYVVRFDVLGASAPQGATPFAWVR
jgi:hypothetical protein